MKKIEQKIQRDLAKQQGFYDGRFRTKVVQDKKKLESKRSCRNFKFGM